MKKSICFLLATVILFPQCGRTEKNKGQSEFASVTNTSAGKPVRVIMTTYTTTMLADGKEHTLIRATVADSIGRQITSANLPIKISVIGDAKIASTNNSIPLTLVKSANDTSLWSSNIVNGSCQFMFQTGTKPDRIKVEVKADNLWPGSHEIHTISPDIRLLKPTKDQIKPVIKKTGRSIGADISFLPEIESRGMKFFDNGKEEDPVKILADHGFNYIRLRLFVNPENEKGYAPGKGFCSLEYTKKMAARVKKYGMKLLLNFHYSDYWADPQQQNKPKAWENLNFEALRDSLKSYTKRVLIGLRDQGTIPEMVQIGNEINHGMLWPDGHISNLDNLAELLKAGVEAVREVDPSIIIMMHIALGGQNREAVFWLDNMIARGVDFDVIGLSYYPMWHGTLDDLKSNLNDLAGRYRKDLNVVEYAMFRKEVHDIVFSLPDNRGIGTFIWEPINIFFDKTGNPTKELLMYDDLNKEYLSGK
ncbi:MAG: glycosyl hydrolase 53 family protein [Bacteroidales bacterium]